MGHSSLGKRVARDNSCSISLPVTVRRAKSAKKWSSDDPAKRLSLKAFKRTWTAFESDVRIALEDLRLPALRQIATAVRTPPPHGDIVAVCVLMGTAAIAGDRAQIFDSVLTHVENIKGLDVLRLRHAAQKSVFQINDALRELLTRGPVVLALDDADSAPPEVIRDIIYVCSAIVKEMREKSDGEYAGSEPAVPWLSLVLGFSTTAEPFHASLGVQESAAVAVVTVTMPRAADCLMHLIDHVLSRQVYGIVFSRRAFEMVEREYFERDSTLSMIMRTFRQIYTLHFLQQKLACVLACPPEDCDTLLLGGDGKGEQSVIAENISNDILKHLRNNTQSVFETGEDCSDDAKLKQMALGWIGDLRKVRHMRYTSEKLVWHLLQATDAYKSGVEDRLGCKKKLLRAQVFKSFLPNGNAELKAEPSVRVVREEILRAQKHQLLNYIQIMADCLKEHSLPGDEAIAHLSTTLVAADASLRAESVNVNASGTGDERLLGSSFKAKGSAAAQGRRRAQLLGAANKRTPMQEKLINMRKAVVSVLDSLLVLVKPIEKQPMQEGVYFSRIPDVLKISGGIGGPAEPRHTVLSAMRDPTKYLGSLAEGQVPDTAISYQILSEGGKLVNIYDWYNSFSAIRTVHMDLNEGQELSQGFDASPEVLLQARFARACNELEFLGLMKHTKRKTDHVQRLVFE